MLTEIKLDNLPNDIAEAIVAKIYKDVGEQVTAGDILFDIEGGKGTTSVKSNSSGKVQSIMVKEGSKVNFGDVLAIIEGEKTKTDSDNASPIDGLDYFSGLLIPKKKEIDCDIVIIGGGPGGYVAAIQAAKLGADVILVEKKYVGGTCLNRGCIPTKALVHSAEIFQNLLEADTFGCRVDNISVDMKKVMARKNEIVNKLAGGISCLLDQHKVKVINGPGRILDNKTVFIKTNTEETTIKAKYIIIATGSRSSILKVPGIENENVISSDQALEMENIPNRMVIIGGGVIGMEFAFIFANFGVDVSVVEYYDECLTTFDRDVCKEISSIAAEKGIKLYTNAKVEEILSSEDGECIVVFTRNGKNKRYILAQKVLMAVGREAFLDDLGIEKIGIELNNNGRGIKVNDRMQTNLANIYAIGDVTNKVLLAHVASRQGIIAVRNIMGQNCAMDYQAVPSAIFTSPEIAMVGITERIAQREGLDVEIGKFPFAANGKALTAGESRGFVKIIKDKKTGDIIGGTIIGPHATDLIAEITLAVTNHVKAEQIAETIYAHPTTSEAVHEAALAVEGGAIHFAG